jgi:hypothetical protein
MTMKIQGWMVAATLVGGLMTTGSAFAGDADFTLVNKTGYPIRSVFIAPSGAKTWGNDRLGDGILENNKQRLIKFSDKAKCDQSMNVTFEDDGSEVEWDDFDLCELNKITLKYNRKSGVVSADKE